MIYNFVSSGQVIAKLYRDLNIQEERDRFDLIEWIAEALSYINVYQQYCQKQAVLEVKDYRALIPCDLHALIQIEHHGLAVSPLGGSFDPNVQSLKDQGGAPGPINTNFSFGYKVNGRWLTFNFREGTINISYLGIITDDEGYPMIPDRVEFKQAIFWYLLRQLILGGFIHPEFNFDKADYQWKLYCGQAKGAGNMPDLGEAEAASRQMRLLIPNINAFRDFFATRDGYYWGMDNRIFW